ncbi:TIGR02300 family protein [uncultured Sphingosinicella sp.]|uniref:TIGR02300 family protein n=1 Tax=uncultured Sphingosinicella sp. TaxID=478748 RepID=UPI0030D748D9
MVKPEWGTKRTCPKCGTRFYDLGADDPVTCIECGTAWAPEPILKSKQPLPFEVAKKEADPESTETALDEDDLDVDVDDDDVNPDDENDLGGDDDLGEVAVTKESGEDV